MQQALQQARSARARLASLEAMLVAGGDARLALDGPGGQNRYGCPATPAAGGLDFASSTASIISPRGYRAASALRERLGEALAHAPPAAVYAREMEQVRGALTRLNGLEAMAGLQVVFAASGTDLHLLVAELVGADRRSPLLCIGVEAEETGSGVHHALAGRHFSERAALGEAAAVGERVAASGAEVVAVPARRPDGGLRHGADIEAELDAWILDAAHDGRRVLLTVADVSKTGLISPSLEAVLALRRRFPRTLEVLVDACQFRLSPASLRAYLDAGLMVAVTGSKFLTGPSFSGALLVPDRAAARFRERLVRPAFGLYSARADWPAGWAAGAGLPEAANFGLLLRWTAALAELEAFRALPEAQVAAFLAAFADAVEARIAVDPRLAALPTRPLDRRALGVDQGWDAAPTIFPFRLLRDGAPLSGTALQAACRALRGAGVRLGQPAGGALRLCASARTVVEALGPRGPEAVIDRALSALDYAASAALP
jgi:hypothetical protein